MPGLLGGLGLQGITAGAGLLKKGVQGISNFLGKGKNLQGLVGGAMMHKGWQDKGRANRLPSIDSLKGLFENSQGLINKMTDWNQFSGAAADDSTEAGHQAVRTAAMMGPMGGSANLALKNRMKLGQDADRYKAWQENMQNMVGHQKDIDSSIFAQHQSNLSDRKEFLTDRANTVGGMGGLIMDDLGIDIGDIFNKGSQGIGGLLKKIPGIS
mgnify:CR=1 FL=1